MNNIKDINISTNYFWTIKILNKNSFIKNVLNYENEEVLFKIINNKLQTINQICHVNNEPLYITNNDSILNFIKVNENIYEKVNDTNKKNIYAYRTKLNEKYSNNYFIDEVEYLVSFDMDTYFVQGGMSWKFSNEWKQRFFKNQSNFNINEEFNNISTIFLNNLIKNFFLEMLKKFSFIDLVNLIKDKKLHNLHRLHLFNNDVYNIDELYNQWTKYLFDGFFYKFYSTTDEFITTAREMFDFFLLLFLNNFAVADELKQKFYLKPEDIIDKKSFNLINNKDINTAINKTANYLYEDTKELFPKKEDFVNIVAGLTRDNIFLSLPNVTYDIGLINTDDFFTKDFYLNKKDIYLYNMFLLYPEMFSINHDSCLKITYDEVINNLRRFYLDDYLTSDEYTKKIDKHILYDNYNYCAFTRSNNTLIYHTDSIEEVEHNTIFRNNLAICNAALGKELNFRLLHIQWHLALQAARIRNKFIYRQLEQELNDISQPSILKKVNNNFSQSVQNYARELRTFENIKNLNNEVKIRDEFDKRQRFIEIIILGFIVASLVSLIDYGNMVWSDLSCSCSGYGANLWGATPNPNPNSWWNQTPQSPAANAGGSMIPLWLSSSCIGLTLFIIFINTLILIGSLIYLIYASKKNKDIAKRKDVKL